MIHKQALGEAAGWGEFVVAHKASRRLVVDSGYQDVVEDMGRFWVARLGRRN
jgi:hypothetical protein